MSLENPTPADNLRERAEALLSKSPDAFQPEDIKDVNTLAHELAVHQAELELQNEELRNTQLALQRTRDRYAALFEEAPVGYVVLDASGIIRQTNATWSAMLNRPNEDFRGTPFADTLVKEDAPIFLSRFRAFFRNPAEKQIEVRFKRAEAPPFFGQIEARPRDVNCTADEAVAAAKELMVIVSDVTERRQAEEVLKTSEELHRTTLASIGDAVISTDAAGNVKTMNPVAEHLTGWQAEEAAGRPLVEIFRIVNAHTRETVENPVDKVFSSGQIVGLANHTILIARDDTERQIADSAAPIHDDGGKIQGVVLVFRDVTEEYAATERLRISEADLRRAQQVAQVGSWRFDLNTKTVTASEEARRIYGTGDRELTIPDAQTIPLEEYRKPLDDALRALLEKGEAYDVEFRIRRAADGAIRDIHSVAEYDPESNIVIGTIQDITERKQAERAVRESEHRFRSFVENAYDIVYALSPDGLFTYISPNWLDFMGEPAEDAIGKSFEPYVHPDDAHLCRAFLERTLQSGEKQDSVEYRVQHRDGSWRWHVSNGSPLRDDTGQVTGYVGIARDVTEMKLISEKLRQSEDLLDATGRMARVGGWELDAETLEVTWTHATYDIHEVPVGTRPPLEEAIAFFHPDDRPVLEQALRRSLEEGKPYDLELRFITAKGRHLVTRTQCTPVVKDGTVIKLRGTFHDITELRNAEGELAAIFDMSLALICVADINTASFTRVNPAFKRTLGYEEEELLSRSFLDFIHPDDADETMRVVEEKLAQGESVLSFVNRYRHKDGSYRWLMWNSHPRPELGVTYATAIDITEQKLIQDRLRQVEKMDAIGQLAGGVAHDFNNQLAGIMGYADMLAARIDDPGLRRYADNILACTRRAGDLTSKLLAFARKGQYQSIPVNMHDTIHDVVEFLNHSIDKRIVVKQILTASPCLTKGDPTQLQSALLNLAINASDAMQEGGELVFETANAELDAAYCASVPYGIEPGRYLHICISDTGCGIPRANLERIFEPFFTTKDIGKGTGMGLAAVYGTIKQHGGSINVYSEVGQGTTFRLYLPLDSQEAAVDKQQPDNTIHATQEATILVVDDEQVIRDMSEDMLTDLGYNVTVQDHGESGLAYFRQHWREIDLVILDMVMPRMNGPETFSMMKKINPEVNVLLASGYSAGGAARELLSQGVRGFIQKPFARAELSTKVARALQDASE